MRGSGSGCREAGAGGRELWLPSPESQQFIHAQLPTQGLLWLLPELMGLYTGPGSLPPAASTDRHLLPQPQGGAEEGPCDLYLALKLLAQMCNRASKPQVPTGIPLVLVSDSTDA